EYLSTQLIFIDAQNKLVMICASVAAVLGVVLAIIAYKASWFKDSIEQNKIHKLLSNDYFIPKFYHEFIVSKYESLCAVLKHCDTYIFDAIVDKIAYYCNLISQKIIMSNSLNLMLRFLVAGFVILLILVWVV
ncbi:NADH-quinone oxidoreductase subunit L, partial [Campylobacter coli]